MIIQLVAGFGYMAAAEVSGGEWQRPLRRLAIPLGHMGLSPCPKASAAIADSGFGEATTGPDTEGTGSHDFDNGRTREALGVFRAAEYAPARKSCKKRLLGKRRRRSNLAFPVAFGILATFGKGLAALLTFDIGFLQRSISAGYERAI